MSITALQGSNAQAVGYNQPAIIYNIHIFCKVWINEAVISKWWKYKHAVVIVNVDAKTDAKRTIDKLF